MLLSSIYGNTFNFEEVKKAILHETRGEKVYINNLTDISTATSKYISVEFANASIYKYYIVITCKENDVFITKYNFNPNGAYSFTAKYKGIELGIDNFFKNFIDESTIQSNYIENNKMQFNSKNKLIQLNLKHRIPSSTIFVNNQKIENNLYIEPVFNIKNELKYFFVYLDNITEEDIMTQNFSQLINKKIFQIAFETIHVIKTQRQPLYKKPNIKTKMYLIKGDKVEILEKKDDWYYILYHGKKDIKAWIPKSAVENK
jgi:hypothetical protein